MPTLCLRARSVLGGIFLVAFVFAPLGGYGQTEEAPQHLSEEVVELAPGEAEYDEALRYFEGDGVKQSDRRGVSLLKDSYELGYLPAANYLGICYQTGTGMIFKRARKGFRILLETAEAGHLPAMYNVAQSYTHGNGVDEDEAAAIEWYRKAIDTEIPEGLPEEEANFLLSVKGDASGQLGSLHQDAEAFEQAFEVFRQGADWDDLHSQIGAAYLKAVGKGTTADLGEADGLLEAARRNISARFRRIANAYYSEALLGDTEAYYLEQEARENAENLVQSMRIMIANELADDEELVSDPEEAAKWFRLAAEADSPYAAARLGLFFLQGRDDLVSREEAKELLDFGARRGVPAARHGLGVYYSTIEPDAEAARKWYLKAADAGYFVSAKAIEDPAFQRPILFSENKDLAMAAAEEGDADGQFATGLFYWRGMGVEEDDEEAEEMFNLAAQQGHPGGHYFLGLSWFFGFSHPGLFQNNQTKGLEQIEIAAKLDYAEAYNQLGWIYESGSGVDTDIPLAVQHYERAIELDPESFAHVRLGRLIVTKDQLSDRRYEALAHFQTLAELESSPAMTEIGKLFREGTVVEQDLVVAREWFERAIDRDDNREALYLLGEMHRLGEGGPVDLTQALASYERAARANHVEALAYVAEAYGKAINGAQFRPRVAARFYVRLLNMGKWEYIEPYYHTLIATEEWDTIKDYLNRLPAPEDDAAEKYFKGVVKIHFAGRDMNDHKWGLRNLLSSFEEGYTLAGVSYLETLQRYTRPPRKFEDTLALVHENGDGDLLCALALLQERRPDWFPEANAESSRLLLVQAAEAGSMKAACVLTERHLEDPTDSLADETLVNWLEPFAERGFENAAEWLERLGDKMAPESSGDPEDSGAVFDERLARAY
jgi:hypothetical protein